MAALPTHQTVRATVYREKGRLQPSLLINVEQINLGRQHTKNLDERDFLLFNTTVNGHRFMCFCTQEGLEKILDAEEIFVDGTCFSCPTLFHQLLVNRARLAASTNGTPD